eukprot:2201521-Heterocapsa_arctica.AAC.1
MNLAISEVLVRRMQLIEEAIAENPDAPNWEGAAHFMGTDERRGSALMAPSLRSHVAGKLQNEAAILKERRKAKEARGPGGRGGGGAKGGAAQP